MSQLAGPLARVFLRYIGAALMTKAGVTIDPYDPSLVQIIEFLFGLAISAGTEGWWYLARKFGWDRS